jgi:hypothetical protein
MLVAMAIMVLPALVITFGIALMAYRRRDRFAHRTKGHRGPSRST